MTAPSMSQQVRLLEQVYSNANIDIDQLDYIEAHGKREAQETYSCTASMGLTTYLLLTVSLGCQAAWSKDFHYFKLPNRIRLITFILHY